MKRETAYVLMIVAIAAMLAVVTWSYMTLVRGADEDARHLEHTAGVLMDRLHERGPDPAASPEPDTPYYDEMLRRWRQPPEPPGDVWSEDVFGPGPKPE